MSKAKNRTSSSTATPPAKLTGTAVTVAPIGMPDGVKVVRRLTMPSLVLKVPGKAHMLAIVDAMRASSVKGKPLAKPVKLEDGTIQTHELPATICTVGDVQTGEMFTLLVPAVVKSCLERDYPGDSYVGKSFYIRNEGKREGKRHIDYTVAEVDVSALKGPEPA